MCSAGISPSVLPVVVLGAAISSPWGRHEELAEITWPQTASAAKNLFPIRQQHARSAAFALVVAHLTNTGPHSPRPGLPLRKRARSMMMNLCSLSQSGRPRPCSTSRLLSTLRPIRTLPQKDRRRLPARDGPFFRRHRCNRRGSGWRKVRFIGS